MLIRARSERTALIVEIVERGQLRGFVPAHEVDLVLLLDEVRLVVSGRDHRVDIGQLAPQSEIGRRAALQLVGDIAAAHHNLLDRTPRGTRRNGG